MTDSGWIEKLSQKMLAWFSLREVKTPLSFYFRVVAAVTVLTIIAMILLKGDLAYRIFLTAILILMVLAVLVGIFAWFRPKNLVYGETGHRAELKFSLGTEKREITPSELATLEGTTNPNLLTSGEGERTT